jgi:hypothetical protein
MNEPNAPLPPNLPPLPPNSPSAGSTLHPAEPAQKKRSAKPWLWGGCGCLTLVLILALVGFFYGSRWLGLGNTFKRYSGEYDPFKGSLATLLPDELAGGIVKFRLKTKNDETRSWKKKGAIEAYSFRYDQIGGGVTTEVVGVLVNFPSSERAQAELKDGLVAFDSTASPKGKGLRFSTKDGGSVGWTNGSLYCVVRSDFAKPAGNFEKAAPF